MPTTLGNLRNMEILNISHNNISGSIPSSFEDIVMDKLKILDVSYNNLSGTYPVFLLNNLEKFEAVGNHFTELSPPPPHQPLPPPPPPPPLPDFLIPIPSPPANPTPSPPNSSTGLLTPLPEESSQSGIPSYIVIIVAIGGLIIAILIFIIIVWRLQLLPNYRFKRESSFDAMIKDNFVRNIPLSMVRGVTHDFSADHFVGEGGYGRVYKGVAPNGDVWAVKRAKKVSKQGLADFQREIDVISRMSHVNILSLKAYCNNEREQILIYDFVPNGSLRSRLKNSGSNPPLTFVQRVSIALDAAEGLKYLHHLAQPTIIHRDVKSDNILLNENLQALVADFGLLKDDKERGEHGQENTLRLVGTHGYIDPEYYSTLKVTHKSDVYSFGVVLFELITGKGPLIHGLGPSWDSSNGHEKHSLASVVVRVHEGTKMWLVDPLLNREFSTAAMKALCELAFSCTLRDSQERPTMEGVVLSLGKIKEKFYHNEDVEGDDAHFIEDLSDIPTLNQSSSFDGSDQPTASLSATITPFSGSKFR